jgi:hypothetical protein
MRQCPLQETEVSFLIRFNRVAYGAKAPSTPDKRQFNLGMIVPDEGKVRESKTTEEKELPGGRADPFQP